MKKIIVFLTLVLSWGLCGCQNGASSEDSENIILEQDSMRINGTVISLNDDMAGVLKALGEPITYSESKSCMYDGYDKVYSFDNLTIVTYPDGEKDYISSISSLSAEVENALGIKVGDNKSKMSDVFDADKIDENDICCIYEFSDYGVCCYLEGDTISEIEIYIITE